MAKKIQRSFYLESDIFNYIKSYQDKNNLSSISSALERIIFSLMLNDNPNIKQKEKTIEKEIKVIPQSISKIKQSMRD